MADKQLVNMIISRGRSGGRGMDLRGAQLLFANLKGVDLEYTDLQGANLAGADLRGANLEGANLSGAILEGADLYGANLRGADFTGAYFDGATLQGANLKGANLTRADLDGANLKIVTYDPQTKWPKGFTPPGEDEDGDRMASRGGRKAAEFSNESRHRSGMKSQRFAASNIRWETIPSSKVLTYDDGIDLWSIRPKMGGWFVSVLLEEGIPLKSTKMHDLIQDAQMEAERRIRAPFDNLAGMRKDV